MLHTLFNDVLISEGNKYKELLIVSRQVIAIDNRSEFRKMISKTKLNFPDKKFRFASIHSPNFFWVLHIGHTDFFRMRFSFLIHLKMRNILVCSFTFLFYHNKIFPV